MLSPSKEKSPVGKVEPIDFEMEDIDDLIMPKSETKNAQSSSQRLLEKFGVAAVAPPNPDERRLAEAASKISILEAKLSKHFEFYEAEKSAADETIQGAASELEQARKEIQALREHCSSLETEVSKAQACQMVAEKALEDAKSLNEDEIRAFKFEMEAAKAAHECELNVKDAAYDKLKSQFEQMRFQVEISKEEASNAAASARQTAVKASEEEKRALEEAVKERDEKILYQRRYMSRLKEKAKNPFQVFADSNATAAKAPTSKSTSSSQKMARLCTDKENLHNGSVRMVA